MRAGVLFFRQGGKGTPDTISQRVICRPPVKSIVIMWHAINVSQSDFTGNYLHVAIQGKVRQKQNRTLAGMSAKSDFIHTIKGISANPA